MSWSDRFKTKSKDERQKEALEGEIKGLSEKITEKEKKILHRAFIRDADLRTMQLAKAELTMLDRDLRKAQGKLKRMGDLK